MKTISKYKTIKSPNYVNILGIKVNSTPKRELLKLISEKLRNNTKFYVVTPNPEIIVQAQKDKELSDSLSLADFSIPDGVGVVWAAKFLYGKKIEIMKGREFMLDLVKFANEKNLKIFLLGGREFVNKKSRSLLISQYPNIVISGSSGPWLNQNGEPVSHIDSLRQIDVIKKINRYKPDILFTAFGAPKQEKWIAKNISKLNVTGIMAVGGSLDYLAGKVKPVPSLLASLGLEWLWRLLQEPTRTKRIINAVIIFPLLVMRSKMAIDKKV